VAYVSILYGTLNNLWIITNGKRKQRNILHIMKKVDDTTKVISSF